MFLANRLRQVVSPALKQPEDSIPLRVMTFLAELVAATSLAYVTRLWWLIPLGAIILGIGHVYAYTYRHNPQTWMRNIGFVGLHIGLCAMLFGIVQGVPYPQAQFAVLAMAFVSIEVFSRLNLYSAFGLGFINIYTAATLSRDTSFLVFLLLYVGILLAFLWRADSEDGVANNQHTLTIPRQSRAQSGRNYGAWGWRFALVGVLLATVVFMLTPRFASRPIFMPISLTVPIESQPQKSVINPAVPLVQVEGVVVDETNDQPSEYFFGFEDSLDLSYRSGLSDTIMMYVSSDAWSYWRGYAYDQFDGRAWTQSDEDVTELKSQGRAYFQLEDRPHSETFTQSFYIVQPMPNIIWTGGTPVELFFPASEIGIDSTGGIRLGESLQEGMIYSVISERVDFEPAQLRDARQTVINPFIRARYLQIPESTTQRTRDLAHTLTADAPRTYDKVIIIRDHLLSEYPYDFYPPPLPPNADAVDNFLFVDQRGFCEMYVSAMVVMLRELGIPARFVVGYGSGDYNPFTGYYEVRANDAHSWVEVYFPDYGWVPFDPTPGWEGTPISGEVQRWLLSDAFSEVDFPSVSIGAVTEFGADVAGVVGVPLMIVGGLLLAVGGAYGGYQVYLLWQRRRAKRYHDDPIRRDIFREYRRIQRKLGTKRRDGQTIQEHAREHPELSDIADWVDRAAYRPQAPDPSLLKQLRAWWRDRRSSKPSKDRKHKTHDTD